MGGRKKQAKSKTTKKHKDHHMQGYDSSYTTTMYVH